MSVRAYPWLCLLTIACAAAPGLIVAAAAEDDEAPATAAAATTNANVTIDAGLLARPAPERAQAVTALAAPSTVHLPAGKVKLADALAALAAGGNATTLTATCDGNANAVLAGGDSTYWQALIAVCAAYGLEPLPGEPCSGNGNGRSFGGGNGEDLQPLAVQTGPVQLAPARPGSVQVWAADGAVLGQIDDCVVRQERGAHSAHRADLAFTLRLEPHLAASAIGAVTGGVAQTEIDGAAATNADATGADGNDDENQGVPDHLKLHLDLARDPAALRVHAHIQATLVQAWKTSLDLTPGSQTDCLVGTTTLRVHLVDANGRGLNGAPGPLLELLFPRNGLFGDPGLRLLRDGKLVNPRGNGVSTTEAGRVLALAYPSLGPGPYTVELTGAGRLGDAAFEPDLHFDLTVLASAAKAETSGMAGFTATPVTWPAQRATLAQAVKLLASAPAPGVTATGAAPAGNQVLLQFGADEASAQDLPAFSGTFWDGVLLVCKTYGMVIAPPTAPMIGNPGEGSAFLAGGPLSLARAPEQNHPTAWQVSGPLLIEVAGVTATSTRGLTGSGNGASALLHVRLEPHVDPAVIGACTFAVDTFAQDEHGRPVVIATPGGQVPNEQRQPRWERRRFGNRWVVQEAESQSPRYDLQVDATELAGDAHALRFSGEVGIEVHRNLHAEAMLQPGVASVISLGRTPVVVTLYDQAKVTEMGINQPAIGLSGPGAANLSPDSIELTAPSGEVLGVTGSSNWGHGGRQETLFYYPISEAGPHRLTISTMEHQGQVRIPFSVEAALP